MAMLLPSISYHQGTASVVDRSVTVAMLLPNAMLMRLVHSWLRDTTQHLNVLYVLHVLHVLQHQCNIRSVLHVLQHQCNVRLCCMCCMCCNINATSDCVVCVAFVACVSTSMQRPNVLHVLHVLCCIINATFKCVACVACVATSMHV